MNQRTGSSTFMSRLSTAVILAFALFLASGPTQSSLFDKLKDMTKSSEPKAVDDTEDEEQDG